MHVYTQVFKLKKAPWTENRSLYFENYGNSTDCRYVYTDVVVKDILETIPL